ncbi:Chitin deacetylase [Termitomyces sp. J132]|nr:Chitin deacetylase [Termitomyces sp. J132]
MLASWICIFALATFVLAIPTRRELPQVITKCTVPNTAALTFVSKCRDGSGPLQTFKKDDGPYIYLKNVSDTLSAAGATGTFFFNDCIYTRESVDGAAYAYSKGHQIGSHTWSHGHLTTLDKTQLVSEFSRTEDALKKILGVVPAFTRCRMFHSRFHLSVAHKRAAYGEYNDLVRQVAYERGQTLVNWDFDSGDSVGKTPEESNNLYDDVASEHPSTLLALNHEVYVHFYSGIVLPHAIEVLQEAGYRLVSVAECLGIEPYHYQGDASPRDVSFFPLKYSPSREINRPLGHVESFFLSLSGPQFERRFQNYIQLPLISSLLYYVYSFSTPHSFCLLC